MCDNLAKYRFIWPGKEEGLACEEHVGKLQGVADVMGLYLQIIPLTEGDLQLGLICTQKGTQ